MFAILRNLIDRAISAYVRQERNEGVSFGEPAGGSCIINRGLYCATST